MLNILLFFIISAGAYCLLLKNIIDVLYDIFWHDSVKKCTDLIYKTVYIYTAIFAVLDVILFNKLFY